jgi:hypothetical protein
LQSRLRQYRCRPRDIAFLKFVIEACDGIGFLRTIDPDQGRVALHVPPGCEGEVDDVMQGLRRVVPVDELASPDGVPG